MRASEYLEKNIKLVTVLRVLAQIGFWVGVVLGSCFLILLAGSFLIKFDWKLITKLIMHLEFGIIRYKFPLIAEKLSVNELLGIFRLVCSLIVLNSIFFSLLTFYLKGILSAVEKGRPFAPGNARRLSLIGIVFLISSLLLTNLQATLVYKILHAANAAGMFSVNFTVNTTMLFAGLLLLILSGIFRYGAYLQEEYDATL